MQYNVKKWGLLPDGTMCHIIQLSYNDISLYVSDYGATFQSMFVTDSSGTQHDIILGYDTPEVTGLLRRKVENKADTARTLIFR